jgi:hypothetical protein
MRVWVSKYSRQ